MCADTVHSSNSRWYACLGNLKPFKSQFLVNRPFRFFVIDGKLCLSKHAMCTGKPMSLMSLQQNQVFSVQQTLDKVMYGKTKRLVQFIEWPTIPFIASDELCAMLDAGHLYFRTIGPGYTNGNKFMKMKPQSGASELQVREVNSKII